jgi:hypothetical protein
MLDDNTQVLLEVANQLTADDIELLKGGTPIVPNAPEPRPPAVKPDPVAVPPVQPAQANAAQTPRGEYERHRTRESKVSTACLGSKRAKHEWWPVGTGVVGQIGSEFFTAEVVENHTVKSGRSLKLTSGSAQGRICITPTRAALEATEDYRQANNLGRGGGVTNGWTFWQPRTGATA